MWNKRIWERIDSLRESLTFAEDHWRSRYHELRADHERLVAALGLMRKVTNTVEYVKKEGPEKP